MSSGERAGRRAIFVASTGVLASVWGLAGSGGVARAADRTFGVSLVGHLNPLAGQGSTNNIYADLYAEGSLVALGSVSTGSGVTLINNSNPSTPTFYSRYEPAGSANGQFRDVIIKNGFGFFGIESSTTGGPTTLGGVHIVNLSNPFAPTKVAEINAPQGFLNNHEMFLDGDFLYIANNRTVEVKVFNVSNPASPTFVRSVMTSGAATDNHHAMTVKNGRMYTSNLDNGITDIYDVTNIATSAPIKLGSFDVGNRNHSTWPSEDGKWLAVARETQGGEVQLWNIENPASASLITSILPATYGIDSYSAHNPVIIGETLFVSWYQAGLQVFNVKNPATPVHLGAYDTFVGGIGNPGSFSGYDGNWGLQVDGLDRILLSDFDNGFFTVDATEALRQVWTYNGGPVTWQNNGWWENGTTVYPDGPEMTAAFTQPAAGTSRTVYVDGTFASKPRVAGIEFLSHLSYTLEPQGGGEIEMISTFGPAKLTVTSGGGVAGLNRVNTPLVLSDDLLVTNNAGATPAATLELTTVRGTNRTITFAGTGETALLAANANFTGGIIVIGGKLSLRHGQATNAQPVTISGGSLVLRNNVSTDFQSNVTFTGTAFLAVGNGGAGSGQMQALGDLIVAPSAAVTLVRNNDAHFAADHVSIDGTLTITLQPGGPLATRFQTLAVAPTTGRLNLNDSPLIVLSTAPASVEEMVRLGRNGGAWNGHGIVTSMPDALSGLTSLGVATAAQAGHAIFGGVSVDGDDVLVMYTYAGDANLDGLISGDDYSVIDFASGVPGASGWANGDFNYDQVISGDDYSIIDFNLMAQGEPFAAGGTTSVAGTTPLPEPAMLVLAPLVTGLVARRRFRRTAV